MKTDREIKRDVEERWGNMMDRLVLESEKNRKRKDPISFESTSVSFVLERIAELQVSIDLLRELIAKMK